MTVFTFVCLKFLVYIMLHVLIYVNMFPMKKCCSIFAFYIIVKLYLNIFQAHNIVYNVCYIFDNTYEGNIHNESDTSSIYRRYFYYQECGISFEIPNARRAIYYIDSVRSISYKDAYAWEHGSTA